MGLRPMTEYELTKEDHLCQWLVEVDHPPGHSRECGQRASDVVELMTGVVGVYYFWYCEEHATMIRRFNKRKLN